MDLRLRSLPLSARLAIAGFIVLVFGLHLLAQATLWASVGGGSLPSADDVLHKYHGHPQRTPLHEVLDLSLPQGSTRAMFWYLDPAGSPDDMTRIEERREVILSWVEAGAPQTGWAAVRQVLHEQASCLECHGFGGQKQDVPLETWEEVRAFAQPGRGLARGALLVSAHNHVFVFGVMALLLGLLGAFTAIRVRWKVGLVVGAFGGALLDIGGWFLTSFLGSPWQHLVMLGGVLFGLTTASLALLVLDEAIGGGRLARWLRLTPRTHVAPS